MDNAPIATDAEVLKEIERFCDLHSMGISTFGRLANGDPSLVGNLRNGRSITLRTAAALTEFMRAYRGEAA